MLDLDQHLAAIGAGDPEAFARWVAGAEPSLRATLRALATHVDAEAVLQEALLRVWQVAPRCQPDGRPNSLLRLGARIARNLAIDELRHNRATAIEPELLARLESDARDERDAIAVAPDPLLRRLIDECRRALPDKPARALAARLESSGGEPDVTLAARLQMRLNTFLQNVARARKLLAACLEKRGFDWGALP
jgi:DNA-directed RNA polymerase specialized sigma24 family protein